MSDCHFDYDKIVGVRCLVNHSSLSLTDTILFESFFSLLFNLDGNGKLHVLCSN